MGNQGLKKGFVAHHVSANEVPHLVDALLDDAERIRRLEAGRSVVDELDVELTARSRSHLIE